MIYSHKNAQLAYDTLQLKHTDGIPIALVHIMEHGIIERLAGTEPGSYRKDPYGVYSKMLRSIGVCLVDQYLADNPLSMGDHGYDSKTKRSATTGGEVLLNGLIIDSPEAVAKHLEEFEIPHIKTMIHNFDEKDIMMETTKKLSMQQELLGNTILSAGYGDIFFPVLSYNTYGYENFFMAWAIYPDVIEKYYKVWTEYCILRNTAVSKAFLEGNWPLFQRLDFDMADSRGLLVSPQSLEKLWVPYFQKAIQPCLEAGFRLIWHCDGNLMQLIPYLLESGIGGFQGFQYEDGMDYCKICKMKTRDGSPLLIEAGVSVTRTLPFGTPDDVVREIRFLVENGPDEGLFLATSSSCTPGTPWENIKTMVEGFQYFLHQGKAGL